MQDWHQKLHNNTTPDDVIICEAYIKFLDGNGDNGSYWAHLNDNGITRQRLESFDRAIKASFHLLFSDLRATDTTKVASCAFAANMTDHDRTAFAECQLKMLRQTPLPILPSTP